MFRLFGKIQIPKIEKWLNAQSKAGLKLIAYKHGFFTFEECKPRDREYFVFIDFLADKKNAFSSDFHLLKSLYGKRKSVLNKTNNTVIEIDSNKKNDDFLYFRLSRTQYYIKQHTKLLLSYGACFLLSMLVTIFETRVLPLTLLILILTLNSAFSIVALNRQKRTKMK